MMLLFFLHSSHGKFPHHPHDDHLNIFIVFQENDQILSFGFKCEICSVYFVMFLLSSHKRVEHRSNVVLADGYTCSLGVQHGVGGEDKISTKGGVLVTVSTTSKQWRN